MAKRLSKEELETDALVTGYAYATNFYRENKGAIIGGTIAVLALIAGIFWYISHQSAQEVNARESITFAESQFLTGNFETALFGSDERNEPGLVEIANRFPRTVAGNLAFYYGAVSHAELGDYESALSMIKEYRVPDGVMGVAPLSLHGMILMQLERYSDAVRMFERAANWDENDSTTPFNLLQAAEAAYAGGDFAKSEQLARQIRRDFPNSQQATQAIRLEGMLSARN
jgi:tetratricopeptide (TPR) repeat protein